MRRAAVMSAYEEPLDVREVDPVTPSPDGLVVETEACGICRSDWHAWKGHWPSVPTDHILGHEPAGRVVEVGADVDSLDVGDRVVVPFNLADGTCPACRRGRTNYCEGATALGFGPEAPGAFAERFPVPNAEVNTVELPSGVSSVAAASLGCRFVTAFQGLDAVREAGLTEHVGLSNFEPDQLREAREVLESPIAAHQVEFHPYYGDRELLADAQEHDYPLVAYSPLIGGEAFEDAVLSDVAEKHDTSPAAVSIAWLLTYENVVTIPKASTRDHLRANFEAQHLDLDGEDVERIDDVDREEELYPE